MPYLPRLKIILQSKRFILFSLLIVFLYVLIFTKWITYDTKIPEDTTHLSGKIISYTLDGNKLSMFIKSKEKVKITYYIDTYKEKEYLKEHLLIGSNILVEGSVNRPYNNTIPNTFNYKEYLYQNKIYVTFNAEKITLSTETSLLNRLKTKFMHKIDKVGSSSPYLYALILGEIDYIDNDVYQEYQKNGTTHLFAVSGMHISALVLLLTSIFKKLKIKEIIGNIVIIIFLFFYMFLVGFTPSVLRGGLLFIFLLINRKSKLSLNTINILYLLFLFLIILNPFYIYNLGFIYSFVTSLGLILFSKKITGNFFIKLAKISAIAFLFSFPITIYNFYEINLLTILNNIIIVPLVTNILFPLTLLTFIFPFLDSLLNIGIAILEWLSHFLNLFEINLVVPKINFLFIILYYLIVYLIYKYNLKYIILLIILTIGYKIIPYLNPNSYVYFLDVGQGDCTVIIGSNLKYAIMIDTGGKITFDSEEWMQQNKVYDNSTNIITFLKSKGITTLDLLIGTHGDIDHIGYASKIMEEIKVKNLWLNNNSINELEQSLIDTGLPNNFKDIAILNLNDTIKEDENDSSLVLYFYIDEISFLLMGDAPKEVELSISSRYSFPVNVLKVGHHGSKTSSDELFLVKMKPDYAIISSGRNNRYNHPSIETINTLNQLNIPYANTKEQGTIEYVIQKDIKKINFYPP